ncbi:hypothetical protein SAMN03159343_2675 [Klenkia marina]|uniref:Uncharacterized protein n=1 Tax=Klenkia marina TaxID=1960309 RepID=A0A1G4YF91_9ACTN|nr:hypothetical protein [Klenkia marina]SCX51999.1 hypothetical protein SAMN03159343_2675 [Klenkia marina]
MPLLTATDAEAGQEVERLTPAGRRARLAAACVVLVLLLAGSVWGDDSEFPFGPFRMYSTRADPDAPVVSTRVVGVTAAGEEVRLSGGEVGLRRAEFEGQLPRLVDDPSLLGLVAESYESRHPSAPELVRVEVVQRHFDLSGGQQTGTYTDEVLVSYELDGAA